MGDAIMNRWWMGVAVLAAGLLPGTAWSQPGAGGRMPSPIGAARIPDPTAIYTGPPLVNGPLTPQMAPAGPPDNLSLPINHSSAFQEENLPPESCWWFNIGAQMLGRTSWGHRPLFYVDNTLFLNQATVGGVPGIPVGPAVSDAGIDKGTVMPGTQAPYFILDANMLDRFVQWGGRGSLGYIIDGHSSWELAGFYMPETSADRGAFAQGRLNGYFINPPVGFEGNNGMWLQADGALYTRKTTIGNIEVNYRYTSGAVTEPEIILGFRYAALREHVNIYTGDDDFTTFDLNGRPDRRRQAFLDYVTHNRILAPQLGFEWTPLNASIITGGMWAKGAWGVNIASIGGRLERGDGFVGFHDTQTKFGFSHIYEIGLFTDIVCLERMRVRCGYQCMWFLGVADAQDQIDADLRVTAGRGDMTGSQFYHGPMFEFQFLF